MKKKALISVFDKSKLEELLEVLDTEYDFISSSGTAAFIKAVGYKVTEVQDLSNFPEILSGRVKTLHPKIFGAILYDRNNHQHLEEIEKENIVSIDLVIVNLYPFAEVTKNLSLSDTDLNGTVAKRTSSRLRRTNDRSVLGVHEDHEDDENAEIGISLQSLDIAIENIDIGGPSLLRAASKNFKHVITLSNPDQYDAFTERYKSKSLDLNYKKQLAAETFRMTSAYDAVIERFLAQANADSFKTSTETSLTDENLLPEKLTLNLERVKTLSYGENPHQQAGLYVESNSKYRGLADANKLHGKDLSFNNLLDLSAAYNIVQEYGPEIPCAVIVKHNNPCGVAIAPNITLAFIEALAADSVSAFGGVVALNNPVDIALANELSQIFLEAVIAPSFTPEAFAILTQKKNIRLIEHPNFKNSQNLLDIKKIDGGFLIQTANHQLIDQTLLKTVTKTTIDESLWVDLILALKVVKHVKSNAIVTTQGGRTLGIGVGQTNRVKSVEDALRNFDLDTRGAVMASDGFFPFADNIHLAAQNHIAAIIQPGGSIRDEEVIKACDELGIAMAFTQIRHFKH
ncbi:MAG: bifunctional phosphoribosylaminoimidazolecarboxamide formyltransferase/IMP cyclohydrolase [Candidatus Melainabacteria bacterium]|nr:bifunctional phosphoribosylaminoimidazolecarboxamide formyltransferase/IMP cyclohydrolase [Candidatus Melainabacteria bacterium]